MFCLRMVYMLSTFERLVSIVNLNNTFLRMATVHSATTQRM